MGTDETQRLVRPLVIPPPMLPCATAPPHSPWRARLQPPLPHTPLGSHSSPTPAARQLPMVYRMGAAPGLIALGWGGRGGASPWSSRVATNRCVPGGIEALQQSSAPRQQCSGAALHTALAVAWGVALGARALGWHRKKRL